MRAEVTALHLRCGGRVGSRSVFNDQRLRGQRTKRRPKLVEQAMSDHDCGDALRNHVARLPKQRMPLPGSKQGNEPGIATHEDHAGFVEERDRKSTRLNSSHLGISYAVFCLK